MTVIVIRCLGSVLVERLFLSAEFFPKVFLSAHQVFPLRVCGVHPSKYMCCLADPRSMLLMGCNAIELVCVFCLFLVFCRRAQ